MTTLYPIVALVSTRHPRRRLRFFANERVTEEDILAGHFRSTRERFSGVAGTILVLHDTTQLSYRRENIGLLNKGQRSRTHLTGHVPLCGLSLHSSLVLTPAGLPPGLGAVKFWTRQAFKGTNALKRKINPTRVPITEKESLRWKIEVFHKILKSGCRVEESGLRTAERLVRLVAGCCILSWRIFWMTMINRTQPEAAPTIALTQLELDLLDQLFPEKRRTKTGPALGSYLVRIARLGGYLARAGDPVPGNIVMWRGLARLTDLSLGYTLGSKFVGN